MAPCKNGSNYGSACNSAVALGAATCGCINIDQCLAHSVRILAEDGRQSFTHARLPWPVSASATAAATTKWILKQQMSIPNHIALLDSA
ncbi:hypothetical protein BC939DRAFT_529839 [Gamsiella multidivaricata]|uniref:uncharacterized protein n=1 Tax=Gamsiella multidivaricata TaxID=101098 RepID=UPI00221FE50A|nr:uncharacterized protein BC939DRAFT_529839 [Gamsiella multidivaricata]KAI7821929.1 hypothetical protein BC939DRAFT_529839 [Gamsiella multidivaricata]